MRLIKELLQDVALIFGLWIVLNWTKANLEFHQWLIVLAFVIAYGIIKSRRMHNRIMKHVTYIRMNKLEFEEYLKETGITIHQPDRK